MTIGQEIILYFEIIPLISILIYAIVKSYIEKQKCFKRQIWALRKAYRKLQEEYEKQEFLKEIKNGLSTAIDKPKISNALR